MNFLGRAKRKVEAALNEIQANSQFGSSSSPLQPQHQNANQSVQYQYQQPSYQVPTHTQPTYPQQQWQRQHPQAYSAPPPNHAPSQQYPPPLPDRSYHQQPDYHEIESLGQTYQSQPQYYELESPNPGYQSQPAYHELEGPAQSYHQQPMSNTQPCVSSQNQQIPQPQTFSSPPPHPPRPQEQQYPSPPPPPPVQSVPQASSSQPYQPEIPQQPQRAQIQPSRFRPNPQEERLPCLAPKPDGARTKTVQSFILDNADGFAVCSNCYISIVARHDGLASQLVLRQSKGIDEKFICDMNFSRIRQIFYLQCVPDTTMQPIKDFFAALIPCTGAIIHSPGPMYIMKNKEVPEFAMCPACFELYIRATAFESYFVNEIWPDTRDWFCDFAACPSYKKLAIASLKKSPPNFSEFAETLKNRFYLNPCPGEGKPIGPVNSQISQHIMIVAKNGKPGRFCIPCYADTIGLTSLEDDFTDQLIPASEIGQVPCDLASGYSKLAMAVAIRESNDDIWRKVVTLRGKLAPCYSQNGMDEAELRKEMSKDRDYTTWYQMNGYPNVLACPNCYWLFVQLFGAAHLCSPVNRPLRDGVIRQCAWAVSNTLEDASTADATDFQNTTAWRGCRLQNLLFYGWDTKDWSLLVAEAALISALSPACGGQDRKFKHASNRRWYGRVQQNDVGLDDATVVMCEECFTTTARGLPYESLFNTDLTEQVYGPEFPNGFSCQPYSNRARSYIRASAKSGDLATFAKYWNHREQLREKRDSWAPIIEAQAATMAAQTRMQAAQINAQIQNNTMQMMLKANAQRNALAMIGSAGAAALAGGETGYRYGNSTIGYNSMTLGEADAQMAWHNASNMPGPKPLTTIGIGGMGDTAQVLAAYEVDNKAYLAVE